MSISEKHLHIISFDVPYPPVYGGIIDIFYKISTLWKAGVKIHLHCFIYGDGKPASELNKYCIEVKYYRRKTGVLSFLSPVPYIIKSRFSKALEKRLMEDNYPVLCEGIHTCGIARNPAFGDRMIIFRPANVEHKYYAGLARSEKHFFKSFFFRIEAVKLKKWEKNLSGVTLILPLSDEDDSYFKKHFPGKKTVLIYGFHPFDKVEIQPGKGEYALFHGDLSVVDNIKVAMFILGEVVPGINIPLVIAGKNPPGRLKRKIEHTRGVILVENPPDDEMKRLIREAHIHLMLTFQRTGVKLKWLISLFRGRHIIVNTPMLTLAGMEGCLEIADTGDRITEYINRLEKRNFETSDIEKRKRCMPVLLFNREKGKILCDNIFGE